MRLAGRYRGCEADNVTLRFGVVRLISGRLTSVRAVDTPADRPALGSRPARAWSARLEAASSWALADCQAAS